MQNIFGTSEVSPLTLLRSFNFGILLHCELVGKGKLCNHRHPNANTYLVLQSCLTVSLDARIQSGVLRAFDDVDLSHHLRFQWPRRRGFDGFD